MTAILQAVLLLISVCFSQSQVASLTGNNNADFATNVLYVDTSKSYGNLSANADGLYLNKMMISLFLHSLATLHPSFCSARDQIAQT